MAWSRALGRFVFSPQVVYLLLALGFVFFWHWPASLQSAATWLDQRTLALTYSTQPVPSAPLNIVVAQVPPDTFTEFARDPLDHPLYEGLAKLRARGQAFHVFLPAPVWTDQLAGLGEAEQRLYGLSQRTVDNEAEQALYNLVQKLAQWHQFRQSPESLWFLPQGLMPEASGDALPFERADAPVGGLLAWLTESGALTTDNRLGWQLGRYHFLGVDDLQPLWWQTGPRQRIQGAPLLIAARATGLGAVRWRDGLLLGEGGWQRPVPVNGQLPIDWRLAPLPVGIMNLPQQLTDVDLVLVAAADSSVPEQVAATANTLLAGHYPVAPRWQPYISVFGPLLLCLLTLPLWRARRLWPVVLASLLLTAGLIAAQIAAHRLQGWWLPTGALVLWLWLALVWRLTCALAGRSTARLEASWSLAWQRLLRNNIQAGKLAEAETQLLEAEQAREADWQLPVTMELAQAYERQRRYDQAEKLYESIVTRAGNFQDVSQRLARLRSLSGGGSGGLESTLIIDEQIINKPVLGRYEIQRELGRGAMGIVYLGRDPKISRMVAIKTLQYKQFDDAQLPDLKARFFREAEAAGRLSHPNIVSVFDVGEEADLAFIAMDYVPGRALSFYTSASRLLPVPIVYGLIAKAADALHYAHKHKIIHRDVKPGNLLYDPETGRLKVSDFGIARLVDNSKTRTGDVMGSPLYMSPEQLKGNKVSEAADIYSLGVTLYQLLSGKLPYDGDTLANLTYQILNGKHASVRSHREELPPSATRITNKALQKDPADRFVSAKEMADALRKAMARDFADAAIRK